MLNAGNPIGVMDSGIGGLTVVRELQRILPGEDIIYFGDSANCPYGNKTSDQIFELSSHMLQFLGDNGVKCTAIACNTISTMADRLRGASVFTDCRSLKVMRLADSLEGVVFALPENLTHIGNYTFKNCFADGVDAKVIIPASVARFMKNMQRTMPRQLKNSSRQELHTSRIYRHCPV